ncbi:nitroreductase [Lysobacter sp. HDW10]|uniref:nitroreductase family protein n=1 Tax=Lysobacter sp. HDW10 TaxID=2714936 RepID=UPI0014077B60|nr:nitroreductase [Lysobacter sp. HDW10]QIK81213.1 nitroreductase [Lysobacter sp. HDW10]
MSQCFECLDARRSVPYTQMSGPGPDAAQLLRILQSAVRVPDHGKRVPFRFIEVRGDARFALGEALEQRMRVLDPDAAEGVYEKARKRFSYAPVILMVVAAQGEDTKIPAHERYASAACVCFAVLLAAQASGFVAQWLTGLVASDEEMRRILGVGSDEVLVGHIHIGSTATFIPERTRPDPAALLTQWSPA